MCLLEYRRYTFSNKQAFKRLLQIINKEHFYVSPQHDIESIIYCATDIWTPLGHEYFQLKDIEKHWDEWTYEDLLTFMKADLIKVKYYSIELHGFKTVANLLKRFKYIFGEVTIHVMVGGYHDS